jgi:hypothetical protein
MEQAGKGESQRQLEPYEAPKLLELGTMVELTAAPKPQGLLDAVHGASQ